MARFEIDKLSVNDKSTQSLARENFNQEIKTPIEVFWREFCQNHLDVKPADTKKKKSFSIKIKQLEDFSKNKEILALMSQTEPWLTATGAKDPHSLPGPHILTIREKNTVGIIGETKASVENKEDEYWVNFWFTEGKPTKQGNQNGRRGQGKVTYFEQSSFNSLFAVTKRQTDNRRLLFGMCYLGSTFHLSGERYKAEAYFCEKDPKTKEFLPISDKEYISDFEKMFELDVDDDFGTTWIFPFVDGSQFLAENICKVIIAEYYYPLINDELEIDVLGELLNSDSLEGIIRKYKIEEPSAEKKLFLENANTTPDDQLIEANSADWLGENKRSKLAVECFKEGDLDNARTKIESGEVVGFKLPLDVQKIDEKPVSSFITVFIQKAEHLKQSEAIVVRSSLTISKEKPFDGVPGKYFGLVKASDTPVATMLADSEDAMHVTFNEPRLKDKYVGYRAALSRVRWALGQIIRTLFAVDGRDNDALTSIFSLPGDHGKSTTTGASKPTKPKPTVPKPNPPKPTSPRLFVFNQTGGVVKMQKNPKATLKLNQKYRVQYAYETGIGVGDPFKAYLHFDFNFAEKGKHNLTQKDIEILVQKENFIDIKIIGLDPSLDVDGFNELSNVTAKIAEI